MVWKCKCIGLIVLAVAVAGCGATKLNETHDVEVTPSTPPKKLIVNPIGKDQKIKVEFSATKPVNVVVFLANSEKEEDAVERDILAKRASAKILTSKEKETTGTLEASVPANNSAVIYVSNTGPSAKVTVKITN
jgi:hypothetical protein